jgi:hypothetical protein
MFGSIIAIAGVRTTLAVDLQPRPDFRATFSELPSIDLPSIPPSTLVPLRDSGSDESVSVRFARDQDGRAWLVISNDYPWQESFEIQWNGLIPEIVRSLEDSPAITMDQATAPNPTAPKSMNSRWRCDIPAHSHGGWELKASEASIAQWWHRAEPTASSMLAGELAKLSQTLTHLTQFHLLIDTPHQGSFEISETTSTVPPEWLFSLNPSGAWQLSDDFARNGKQSLRFDAKQPNAIGWIQSPAFTLPEGGRVAAEAWIRFESAHPSPKIVATTTLLRPDGSRQDWKQTYLQNHFFAKNSEWHRIDFPTLNLDALGIKIDEHCQVRLALDVEGPSRLWIDDIAASRSFLDEEERRKLRSQLFAAQRELTQNRLEAAWHLTQTELSQYVLENAGFDSPSRDESKIAPLDEPLMLDGEIPIRKAERQPFRRKLR